MPFELLLPLTIICLLLVLLFVLYVVLPAYSTLAPIVCQALDDYVNAPTDDPPAQTTDEPHSDAVRPSVRPPVRPPSDAPSVPNDALAGLRSAVQAKNAKACRAEVARLLVACGATTTLIREVIKGSNDQAGALVDAPPVAPPEPRLMTVDGEYQIRLDDPSDTRRYELDESDETRYMPLKG